MALPTSNILSRLAGVRRRWAVVTATDGALVAAAAVAALLAAGLLADWWWELPRGGRAALLAVYAAAALALLVRRAVLPVARGMDDDEAALRVERAAPDFRGRLIASVQLARPGAVPPGASAGLVDALAAETRAMAAERDFGPAVPAGPLARRAARVGAGFAVAAAVLYAGGGVSRALLRRAFLHETPIPRDTRVVNLGADRVVGIGDPVAIEAAAEGVVPRRGRVRVTWDSGRSADFPLEPDAGAPARFARMIENVQESFAYEARLNDGRGAPVRVRAVPRPATADLRCRQACPAYTGLGTVALPEGDLRVLAGSRLLVDVTATKPVREGVLRFAGADAAVPLRVDPGDGRRLSVDAGPPPAGATGFSVHLTDEHGLGSKDPVVHRLEVAPDRAPTLDVAVPERREELVTPTARMAIEYEASDDFGVTAVRLLVRVDGGGAERAIAAPVDEASPRTFRRRFEWRIAELEPPPREGTTVVYRIEARDANNATGPGVTLTEPYRAKVVSAEEKRAELMARLGETLQAIQDVSADQEKLGKDLRTGVLER